MSTRTELVRRTADQWYRRHPDKTARVFHNLLLQPVTAPPLRRLLGLFAEPPPQGTGRYNHHDGYRT